MLVTEISQASREEFVVRFIIRRTAYQGFIEPTVRFVPIEIVILEAQSLSIARSTRRGSADNPLSLPIPVRTAQTQKLHFSDVLDDNDWMEPSRCNLISVKRDFTKDVRWKIRISTSISRYLDPVQTRWLVYHR